jgi:hypothetical protein
MLLFSGYIFLTIVQYYFIKFMEGTLECVFIVKIYYLVVSKNKSFYKYLFL